MGPRLAGVVLVALTAALSGCIQGAYFPAEVPASELAQRAGWVRDDAGSTGGTAGLAPVITARYFANIYNHAPVPFGAVYVISVSDVPLLDEQEQINKQLQPRLREAGVTLTERSRGSGSVGGQAVNYVVSDAVRSVSGITTSGLAIEIGYACAGNGEAVRVFGYAMIGPGGILQQADRGTWEELAGRADQGVLAGLASAVKCA